MSPQRRKVRGGGAGKVAVPPPSSAPLAIDSPPLLPSKPSRQKGKALSSILPASCKSSITPSTAFSTKLKLKERSKTITASAASSSDAFLSVTGLCNARAASKPAEFADCSGPPPSSSSRAISRPRKCTNTINHDKVSLLGSAIAHARTQKAAHDREGMKASKPSVFCQDSSQIGESRQSKNKSCRNPLQKEEACDDLRWSTMSLLSSQVKRMGNADEKKLLERRPSKECLNAFSHRRSSLEGSARADCPLYVLSPDRRYSMGSFMSIGTSLQSVCEECLDDDTHVRLLDCEEENIDSCCDGVIVGKMAGQSDVGVHACIERDLENYVPDELSRSLLAWRSAAMDACTYQSSISGKPATENMGISSSTTGRVPFETSENQTISNTHAEAAPRRISMDLSRSNKGSIYIHSVDALRPQSTEDKPNQSVSLHQRLELLEGRVSQIASDLRKTKEMLDVNNHSGSAALLSDIHGKISNIEQAMTERTSQRLSSSHKDAPMEEIVQNSQVVNYGSSHQDSNPSFSVDADEFNKPSITELSHQIPPRVVSTATSRKTDRLKFDQQELEDRLFPHRKLLRSRVSLQNGVMESRAALHSKLEDAAPESFFADDAHVAGLPSGGNQRSLKPMTGIELTCSSILGVQNEAKFDEAPPSHERMFPSNGLKFHQSQESFVDDNPPTAIKKVVSTLDDTQDSNGSIHCSHIRGRQDVSYHAEVRTQEPDSALQFLQCDETLQFKSSDTQQDLAPDDELEVDSDELQAKTLRPIGHRIATAGWYACDGEAIVLVHDDGGCSFYDVANMEEKALYKCPEGYPAISWSDCWMIRAAGSDGRANNYIVAATSGSALDAGFCSWDFNTKEVAAYHMEDHFTCLDLNASLRCSPLPRSPDFQASRALHETTSHGFGSPMTKANVRFSSRHLSHRSVFDESSQWWYRPCGPLMASAGSSLKHVAVYDIRDGETVMTWETKQPIMCLDFSSPLQWRNRGKLALAEEQAISIWDVNTLDAQCLHHIELPGKRVCALHVHNADAEYSGGVRQRLSSSDMEAFDGICCTQDDINVLDFRTPSGLGICLPTPRHDMQSVYARGDMVFIGGMTTVSKRCVMQQWSVRMGQPVSTYAFRPSSSHYMHLSLPQVWGNSNTVMAVNGNGLHIFKGPKELANGHCDLSEEVEEVKGTPTLFNPSFDYTSSQILLISRDRPASWCYWAM